MEQLLILLVAAVFLEALVQHIKEYIPARFFKLTVLLLGQILAWGWRVDVLQVIGDATGHPFALPYVGIIVAGVIISRGSNATHDILKAIENAAGALIAGRGPLLVEPPLEITESPGRARKSSAAKAGTSG